MVTSPARLPEGVAGQGAIMAALPVGGRVMASVQVSSPEVEGSEEAGADKAAHSKDPSVSLEDSSPSLGGAPAESSRGTGSAATSAEAQGEEEGEEAKHNKYCHFCQVSDSPPPPHTFILRQNPQQAPHAISTANLDTKAPNPHPSPPAAPENLPHSPLTRLPSSR